MKKTCFELMLMIEMIYCLLIALGGVIILVQACRIEKKRPDIKGRAEIFHEKYRELRKLVK